MAKYNKPTWAQRFSDFINRVAPFDGNPLIQDSEHETVVGEDLGDSIVFGEAVEASINSPASAFNVDFDTTDYYAIDTTGVGTTAFTITLQNLDSNRVGILNVTKKAGDTIAFSNGEITPSKEQDGTDLKYSVKIIGTDYFLTNLKANNLINDGNTSTFTTLKTKVIEIGDWDMDASSSVSVDVGVDDGLLRMVDCVVINDAGNNTYKLTRSNVADGDTNGGVSSMQGTTITLVRVGGAFFDSTDFDSTGYNRGWVTIIYEE